MSRGSDPLTIDKFGSMTAIIGVTTLGDFRPGQDHRSRDIFTNTQSCPSEDSQCLHTKAQAWPRRSDQIVLVENRSDGGSDG